MVDLPPTSGAPQSVMQQKFHLRVDAPQLVGRPALQAVVHVLFQNKPHEARDEERGPHREAKRQHLPKRHVDGPVTHLRIKHPPAQRQGRAAQGEQLERADQPVDVGGRGLSTRQKPAE